MQRHTLFRLLAIAAFAATYVTILLGGNVMASDSGLACPDWPTCHGTLLPPFSGATAIEWSHRLSAFVTGVLVAGLALVGLVSERRRPALRGLAVCAAVLVLAQAFLGGLVVETDLVVGIVLLHFLLATILFGLLLLIAFLANLREIPRRWAAWAEHAADDEPATVTLARLGRSVGDDPSPEPSPVGGADPP
ncbi:MAG: COX15/CtaA family protein [Thermoplasmata archaeon]|nr:COX15/CtaA family protein [Thermoplasmata archaeon]MCI4356818.1 COX15/CtaA family protein [Thermoplasmata archaeon]